jgi:hypothetical protein
MANVLPPGNRRCQYVPEGLKLGRIIRIFRVSGGNIPFGPKSRGFAF